MLLIIGKGFELEVNVSMFDAKGAVFLRIGRFSRYWNTQGMPSGSMASVMEQGGTLT